MNIRLMSNIPDQQIIRGIKNAMEGHCQFNHAEIGSKMPASHRDLLDDLSPNLSCQLLHLWKRQGAQIFRTINAIKNPRQRFPPLLNTGSFCTLVVSNWWSVTNGHPLRDVFSHNNDVSI